MVRTQIQITDDQARSLKRLAAKEGKSVAELIRISMNNLLRTGGTQDPTSTVKKRWLRQAS